MSQLEKPSKMILLCGLFLRFKVRPKGFEFYRSLSITIATAIEL